MPLVSTPATNRARTLRKRISSLETGIAAIRQPQDSRPISPCRRLLCCYLGRVSLSFHHRSFLRPWLLHRCQTISLVFVNYVTIIYYRVRENKHTYDRLAYLPSGSPDQWAVCGRPAGPPRLFYGLVSPFGVTPEASMTTASSSLFLSPSLPFCAAFPSASGLSR